MKKLGIRLDKRKIDDLIEYAMNNIVDMNEVKDTFLNSVKDETTISGEDFGIGKESIMEIEPAFYAKFTIDKYGDELMRHLSIGVTDPVLRAATRGIPPGPLIKVLIDLFGFKNPIEECFVNASSLRNGAVTIIDPIDGDWSKHKLFAMARDAMNDHSLIQHIKSFIGVKVSEEDCENCDDDCPGCHDKDDDFVKPGHGNLMDAIKDLMSEHMDCDGDCANCDKHDDPKHHGNIPSSLNDFIETVGKSVERFQGNENLPPGMQSLKSKKPTFH